MAKTLELVNIKNKKICINTLPNALVRVQPRLPLRFLPFKSEMPLLPSLSV